MRFININEKFTELVSSYINKGYTFNTASMGGSEGEISRVDLTNGAEIIRIYVKNFNDWENDMPLEGVEIVVGLSTDKVVPHMHCDFYKAISSSRLDVIYNERYYTIGCNQKLGRVYGTKGEAEAAIQKRIDRRRARRIACKDFSATPEMMEIAKRFIRRKVGSAKRIRTNYISLKKSNSSYTVWYQGKSYTMQ